MIGKTLGDYKILKELGRGGMGVVYLVEQKHLKKEYALKVLPEELNRSESFINRFYTEARIMAELDHPNIVKVHYMGCSNNTYYLVMEYIGDEKGRSRSLLSEVEEKNNIASEGRVKYVILQVCSALRYAHNFKGGVVHRDIKPSNILIDTQGNVKISDFGLAKVVGMEYLQSKIKESFSRSISLGFLKREIAEEGAVNITTGSILGTYDYMSPEQREGKEVGKTSDIYAVGVLVYQMLTGKKPVGRFNLPSEINNNISHEWDAVVEKSLQVEPGQRYQSTEELEGVVDAIGKKKIMPGPQLRPAKKRAKEVIKSPELPESPFKRLKKTAIVLLSLILLIGISYGIYGRYRFKNANPIPSDFTNGIGMKFVLIKTGTFLMGSPTEEESRKNDEPQHRVTLTKDFYLQATEVTQTQYQEIMEKNPSGFKGENLPVEFVTWYEAVEFCRRLSKKEGNEYRLPTEAEWEYACRAGTTTPFYFGETISTTYANYNGNYTYGGGRRGTYKEMTVEAGSFPSNACGLYDMHGNIWEWCSDWYGDYPLRDVTDPTGSDIGDYKVIRGGSWFVNPINLRSADRMGIEPNNGGNVIGFRCAMTPKENIRGKRR